MKKFNFKHNLLSYLWISLATLFLTSFPANAQDFFGGARKNADDVFKDTGGSGVDLSSIPKLFFGAILLFLFATATWQGVAAYRELSQGGADGGNWAPILYGFIAFGLLLAFLGFVQKFLFSGAT